jgi:hypothetical protein
MPNAMKNVLMLSAVLSLAAAGCGDAPPEDEAELPSVSEADTPAMTVQITAPGEGAEVAGPAVTVTMEVEGVSIVPAGNMTAGTGHHHLYLDADLTAADVPVPTVPGSIVHMGDASSSFTFENVEPGEHRLIAVVADGAHFPLQPWVVDTVTFTVR